MKYCKSTYIVIVFLAVLPSCTAVQEETAFERVVDYYRSEGDTLKMRAAEFLRDYSDYHRGVSRHWVDSIGEMAENIDYNEFATDTLMVEYLRSSGYHFIEENAINDRDTISEAFLRSNIDLAFDSWHRPWARDIPFDDFCRFILPYRNLDEELSDWRLYFKRKYEPTIADSVSDPTSLREVALYLMRRLKEEVAYSPPMGRLYGGKIMSLPEMQRTHYLECCNLANFGTLALRACGVPCATIELFWRFNEVSHFTILLPQVGSNPRACRLSVYDELIEMGEPKDTMATYRTWMYSYDVNPSLALLSTDTTVMPSFYNPQTRQDITSLVSTTYDVAIPLDEPVPSRHAFLCRFSRWQWMPIREGYISGDSAYFRDATIRQWYRLGVMRGDSLYTFGRTFTIVGPQVEDSVRPSVPDNYHILYYNCTGDTAMFKRVYNCEPDEKRLTRPITTYYWDEHQQWHPVTQDAVLWGLNEKTGEYRVFDESMRGRFRPVFHLMQVYVPKWTVFYDHETFRPLGFIVQDPESKEGYLMQF